MQKITDTAANIVSYPNYCHTEHLHITHFLTFHVPSFLLMSQEGGTNRRVREVFIFCTLHYFLWHCDPTRVMTSSFLMFLDNTRRRSTVGRTPLDEWPARRRDLYLTTHDTHNRQTSLPLLGFEPTISASERPQTYAYPSLNILKMKESCGICRLLTFRDTWREVTT
jgi:hypothetical protein